MVKKMFVEVGGWQHGFVVLELIVAICSIFSEHQFVGGQTTVAPPGGQTTVASTGGAVTKGPAGPTATEPPIATYLGDMCENSTTCIAQVANSECKDAGDNSGNKRCRCSANFYPYNAQRNSEKKDYKCGKVLTNAINSNCEACEDNEGTCVRDEAAKTGVFCQCPISRSGDNCEIIHVNVSCSMSAMRICYSPHENVDFANGWHMYTLNHRKTPQCGSATVNNTDTSTPQTCQYGNQELVLSLNQTELDTCGTTHIEDAHNKRYMNKIEIQKFDSSDNIDNNSTTISFNVFCSFTAYQDQTFPGVGIGRVNGNDEGGQVNPNITLLVYNQFNQRIQSGVTLRVGDIVKFVIILALDGNYESLQVLRVTASTSPVMPDSTAETRALMTGGCPIPGEATGDSWYWEANKVDKTKTLEVKSGSVKMFKLASSEYVFIHCAVKLCMLGDTSCPNYNKKTCEEKTRKKRAMDSEIVAVEHHGKRRKREATNVNIQTGLRVEDPNSNPQTDPMSVGSPGFIALLVILAVIAAILIIVTIVVAVKTRRRKSDQNYQPRPQLFALPRISRTHERF